MESAGTTSPLDDGGDVVDPPELDVSKLPSDGFDWYAPLWWGNLLMLFIETTTVALLVAVYFYLMRNEQQWPPPQAMAVPPIAHPVPGLTAATLNAVLLLASCVLMFVVDRWARHKHTRRVKHGLLVLALAAALSCVLTGYELPAIHFKWNENAYASVVWTIICLHLIYILGGLGELILMTVWIYRHGMDDKHALDVTLVGFYWYWVAGVGAVLYLILFWVPRWV
jgi:cytochrome c oxidase subunit 3